MLHQLYQWEFSQKLITNVSQYGWWKCKHMTIILFYKVLHMNLYHY